jgi:hypothetical protein
MRHISIVWWVLMAAMLAAFSYSALAQAPPGGGTATGTGYPVGSQPVTASTTGTTGALTVTLTGSPGQTTYICGFLASSGGTTGALVVGATVTGTISGALNVSYVFVSSGQGLAGAAFPICIPASALNTAIVVTVPGGGAGTSASLFAWGYRL